MKKVSTLEHSQTTASDDMESAMDLKFVNMIKLLFNQLLSYFIYFHKHTDKN